jgi:hypothetical protein
MRWGGQSRESKEKGSSPVGFGPPMDWAWHVPNDEVVLIAVCYPETKSEIGPFKDVN